VDARALDAVGWTVGDFDKAVTLRQLGYRDGADCELGGGWGGGLVGVRLLCGGVVLCQTAAVKSS